MKQKKIIIALSAALGITVTLAVGLGAGLGATKNQKDQPITVLKEEQKNVNPQLNNNDKMMDLTKKDNSKTELKKENPQIIELQPNQKNEEKPKSEPKEPENKKEELPIVATLNSAAQISEDFEDETKFKLGLEIENANDKYAVATLTSLVSSNDSINVVSAKTKVTDNKVEFIFSNLDPKQEYLLTGLKIYDKEDSEESKEVALNNSTKFKKLNIKTYEKTEALALETDKLITNVQYSIKATDPNNVLEFVKEENGDDKNKYKITVELDTTKYKLEKDNEFTLELIDTTLKRPKPIILNAKLAENLKDLVFEGNFYRVLQKNRKYLVKNLNLKNKPTNVIFKPKVEYSFFIKKEVPTYHFNQGFNIERIENGVTLNLIFRDPEALVDYHGTVMVRIAPVINGKVDEAKAIEKQVKVDEVPNRHINVTFDKLEHKEYKIVWFGTKDVNFENKETKDNKDPTKDPLIFSVKASTSSSQ
ncbi:hypothetical protein [Ureaplasma diversum]|uniref:Uncharacterized protein n=1 Tax=Ureaplasma diversum NCTC 246 TaxID=1188241 RepID=A0A084F0Z6_9BACT|nr:hypothetical protein [Ureaplasma diversum]KEZ23888.1 Hypothetical protein, predicted transmembrane protein [Ureaplasma diversum NCTC 246]